ncbi:MAG: helix-turn-helix domain-containing protein [Chitinophagales bacterium]|nr:helix-turn-helix domain-containing protein [Chitinophagales bacterium]
MLSCIKQGEPVPKIATRMGTTRTTIYHVKKT